MQFPDGVDYLVGELTIADMQKEGRYRGVRVKMPGRIGNVREVVQIDIGVGDHVTPGPQLIQYPTLLDGFEPPELYAYSLETSLAEKFEAMIALGEYNSRMKDFYDVYYLLPKCDDQQLAQAVRNTFARRKTPLIANHPLFTPPFYTDKRRWTQWNLFIRKNELQPVDFPEIGARMKIALEPIYHGLLENK